MSNRGHNKWLWITQGIRELKRMVKMPAMVKAFLGFSFMQSYLKRQIDRQPEGPTDEQRKNGYAVLIGGARNERHEVVRSRLRTPEGYSLTALTGLSIAQRVAKGEFKPGFQTPSSAFGADLVLQFESVTREDLNS